MDEQERKLGMLLAAFDEINAAVKATHERFEQSIRHIGPLAGEAMKGAVSRELGAVREEVEHTTVALRAMIRAANWRTALVGGVLVIAAVTVTLIGFWLLVPSRQDLITQRAEYQQRLATIELLNSRGGHADVKTCGPQNEHLCVRVVPLMGRYGPEKDYFVIRGY